MVPESVSTSESNSKRRLKNKIPKRLRHKNKPNDIPTEENVNNEISKTDQTSVIKPNTIQESAPFILDTLPSTASDYTSPAAPMNETSIDYWKFCTKKALDILEKQASNRRKFIIERHQERINSTQCLLGQRERIDILTEENHSMCQVVDSLRNELRTKDETLKMLQEKLHDRDGLILDNECLSLQLQSIDHKLQRVTMEYSKKMEENRQHQDEYDEQIQSLMDEIERIKRDLVLEEYRKQEAERKVRSYEEKIKVEQNLNKKTQQDIIQLKQDLKSIHMRYDSLQIEMLAMHEANISELSLIPAKDTNDNEWPKKRTIPHEANQHLETKRSKRKTRDRTESAASTRSACSDKQNKAMAKSSKNKENEINDPSLISKRKTLKSKKSSKNHLPMVTLTQASPSNGQGILMENDSTQLLIPSLAGVTSESNTSIAGSHGTSCESQPLNSRSKKPSRYPCRRAQRPVKQIETIDQKELRSVLKLPMIPNDDFIPIDDFSNGFTYESHLGRFCKNVIVVSARHPHSFFLQTIDDLTFSDNFFSKMNEFYNRCFDAQRLVISKAALRVNLCCVARDEIESDVWNRAQLLEYYPESDQCSLLLVDIGTWQECVPRSKLRHIILPFRQECVRSVPCRLAGIAPAKPEKNSLWNEYAIKTFRNVIDNVPAEVEVLDCSPNGSYFVNLFVTHDTFVCVNDFLLYHKIAIPVDDCKTLKPEELDPTTHEPVLAIIHEFNLQGELLAEELKANQRQQKEEQRKKYEKQQQCHLDCRLPCIRIIDIPFLSDKKLIFARYKNWVMVPWFSISDLFRPSLSESTIQRFALLYKFSPVYLTPLSNAVLCASLEKYMTSINDNRKTSLRGNETKIALYSIDCVRKLLLNHHLVNEFIFERLDEAREAEMKDDQDFWEIPSQNQLLMEHKKLNEESKQSQMAVVKSH
ncbi:unnamed protein product, partial [Rotaria socialis]